MYLYKDVTTLDDDERIGLIPSQRVSAVVSDIAAFTLGLVMMYVALGLMSLVASALLQQSSKSAILIGWMAACTWVTLPTIVWIFARLNDIRFVRIQLKRKKQEADKRQEQKNKMGATNGGP